MAAQVTITLTFGPWTYTILALVVGGALQVFDRGGSDPFGWGRLPGTQFYLGALLWLTIPFVWLGVWIAR